MRVRVLDKHGKELQGYAMEVALLLEPRVRDIYLLLLAHRSPWPLLRELRSMGVTVEKVAGAELLVKSGERVVAVVARGSGGCWEAVLTVDVASEELLSGVPRAHCARCAASRAP